MGIQHHEPTAPAVHPGASPTTGYPRVDDPVPGDWPVMHAVGPMYFIGQTAISPDRFIPTAENPGISFTVIPPGNYEIPEWPNGNEAQRRQQAAQRLPRFSQAARVLTTTPAAVSDSLAAIGITPRFVFKPTTNDPFHAELLNPPPSDDPQAAVAANLVLRAIISTQPLSELPEQRVGN